MMQFRALVVVLVSALLLITVAVPIASPDAHKLVSSIDNVRSSCTPHGGDVYASGNRVPCCKGFSMEKIFTRGKYRFLCKNTLPAKVTMQFCEPATGCLDGGTRLEYDILGQHINRQSWSAEPSDSSPSFVDYYFLTNGSASCLAGGPVPDCAKSDAFVFQCIPRWKTSFVSHDRWGEGDYYPTPSTGHYLQDWDIPRDNTSFRNFFRPSEIKATNYTTVKTDYWGTGEKEVFCVNGVDTGCAENPWHGFLSRKGFFRPDPKKPAPTNRTKAWTNFTRACLLWPSSTCEGCTIWNPYDDENMGPHASDWSPIKSVCFKRPPVMVGDYLDLDWSDIQCMINSPGGESPDGLFCVDHGYSAGNPAVPLVSNTGRNQRSWHRRHARRTEMARIFGSVGQKRSLHKHPSVVDQVREVKAMLVSARRRVQNLEKELRALNRTHRE